MARFKTALILFFSALLVSTFALAQDPGTYRLGQPYAAAQAPSSTVCDSQCRGDAACRGWNFVRTNPRQKNGICEFNSVAVDPIRSPVSVSANQTQVINYSGQSRIIPAGVRTTRIGTPAPVVQAKAEPQTKRNLASSSRKVIRQAVLQQAQPQATAFRHNLDAAKQKFTSPSIQEQLNQSAAQRNSNVTQTSNGLPPRAPQARQNRAIPQQAAPPSAADPRLQRQVSAARNPAPTIASQLTALPQTQAPHVQQPVQTRAAHAPRRGGLIKALTQSGNLAPQAAPQAGLQPFSPANARPLTVEEASQKSLYGHLNDDVSIPKPITPDDFNVPEDQPIPTVTSVPVKPVDRESFSGLAGG